MSDDHEHAFSELAGGLEHAMFVVTARRGEERTGCLVGFATQVSIAPPRFLVCLSMKNHTYGLAQSATHLAVHVVPDDRHDLAELFGGETGDDTNKFARCASTDGPHGLPILDACPSWFVGAVRQHVPFGDHVGFLLDPESVGAVPPGPQLTSTHAMDIDPGHDA
jgi:flavin reductase (DIM6/NTAB) family NADH-FMN oxidoreductase RutF